MPLFDRLRYRIAHAHQVHIFVFVVLISVTPWPLRLITTTISMHCLRGLVRSIRSLVLAAAGLLQTPANSRGWCAAHLRLSRRSSDGAPRIVCFVIGKLLLPAAMAEPRAAAQKTDKEAPAKQNINKYAGKASTMLAEAVAAAVPAASHVEPRAAQQAVRLNAKTKTEVSTKSSSAVKMARWRAARKPAHEAAAATRAKKNAQKQRRKQASGSESPLVADSFVDAVAR